MSVTLVTSASTPVAASAYALLAPLRERIRQQIKQHCTARHVPARILQVDAIPRTKSGKIVELAVREVVHNRPVNNTHALADPEVLNQYRNRPELAS